MVIPLNFLFFLLTMIALNLAFILKSYQIWKQSNVHQLESVEKYQKLDRAITVIIRHCILGILWILVAIARLSIFTFGGDHSYFSLSVWMEILLGCVIFMFFPIMDRVYKLLFGSVHSYIFRKWKARYLEHVQRVAARNLYKFMLQMNKDMFREQQKSSTLRTIGEGSTHRVQEEIEAKYNEELQLSVTQIMTSSCTHKDRESDEENLFAIDFDYKDVIEQLDPGSIRVNSAEENPIDAVAMSTIHSAPWPVNGDAVVTLETNNVVLQLSAMNTNGD